MARYTDHSREQVRDAVDFAELVGARTELRQASPRRMQGLCPFHDERTPSFGIDPVEKLYHCFGCGEGGDVFKFVMTLEQVDFAEALEMLADRYGVTLEREAEDPKAVEQRTRTEKLLELLERTAKFYERLLWESDEAEAARKYLSERGLNEETLRFYRVGFSPPEWERVANGSRRNGFSDADLLAAGLVVQGKRGRVYDRFRGRIMFPLTDPRGRVRGFGGRGLAPDDQPKYINSPDCEAFRKGRWLYATDKARVSAAKSSKVILVEGYTDVLALHQAEISNVVAQMGTALTAEQAQELARLAPTIMLCLDADKAGYDAMVRAADLIRQRKREARVVTLPAGSDPCDFVREQGHDAFTAQLDDSLAFEQFQIERILAQTDLGTTSARDQALVAAARVIDGVEASLLRDELVEMLAQRVGAKPELVNAVITREGSGVGQRPSDPRMARGGGVPSHLPGDPRSARGRKTILGQLNRREETERAFLSLCIALPEEGEKHLSALDLDSTFSSSVLARAANYLSGRLAAPANDLPVGDSEFAQVIAELVVRAGELTVTPTTLEIEALQLELGRIDREIAATRSKKESVSELAVKRQEVLATLRSRMQ